MQPLPRSFFTRPDPVRIARDLLGKALYTHIDGRLCGGLIVETEAYSGTQDRACHAHGGRRTPRTEVMYREGGVAYVYLTYGLHHLFNIVTNEAERADAVLIRAVQPLEGIDWMLARRGLDKPGSRLTAGPGMLCQALGIRREHNGAALNDRPVWVEDRETPVADAEVASGPRVGVGYAGGDAWLPWRFRIRGNPWVSRARPRYDPPAAVRSAD